MLLLIKTKHLLKIYIRFQIPIICYKPPFFFSKLKDVKSLIWRDAILRYDYRAQASLINRKKIMITNPPPQSRPSKNPPPLPLNIPPPKFNCSHGNFFNHFQVYVIWFDLTQFCQLSLTNKKTKTNDSYNFFVEEYQGGQKKCMNTMFYW